MSYRADTCYSTVSLVSGCSQNGGWVVGGRTPTKWIKKIDFFIYAVISNFYAVHP